MRITKEIFELAKTDNGGYTKAQLGFLGIVFPPPIGWQEDIMNATYTKNEILTFIWLRQKVASKPKIKAPIRNKKECRGKYSDPRWRKLRATIIERDQHRCTKCGSSDVVLHVHHLKYYGKYLWSVNEKHLTTLCEDCHNKIHS